MWAATLIRVFPVANNPGKYPDAVVVSLMAPVPGRSLGGISRQNGP